MVKKPEEISFTLFYFHLILHKGVFYYIGCHMFKMYCIMCGGFIYIVCKSFNNRTQTVLLFFLLWQLLTLILNFFLSASYVQVNYKLIQFTHVSSKFAFINFILFLKRKKCQLRKKWYDWFWNFFSFCTFWQTLAHI